jgi:hypothetical protein
MQSNANALHKRRGYAKRLSEEHSLRNARKNSGS